MQFKSLSLIALACSQLVSSSPVQARDDKPNPIVKATYDHDQTHFSYEVIFKDGDLGSKGELFVNATLVDTKPNEFGWDKGYGILPSTNLKLSDKSTQEFKSNEGYGKWSYTEDGNSATLSYYVNGGGDKIEGAKILLEGVYTPENGKEFKFSGATTDIKYQDN